MMNKIQQLNMCQRGLLTKTQPVDLSLYFFGVFFFKNVMVVQSILHIRI